MTAPAAPRLTTLILLTAFSTLSLNLITPSLAAIAADFKADYALVNLAIAGYLAVTAVLQLVIGPLSDRYGRRPVMLGALTVFLLATLGCLLAPTVGVFLGFRMLQGAVIAGAALSPAILRDIAPAREAASRLAYLTMAMAAAPMLGPTLGGALEAGFGWRASFVFFLIAGLGLLGLAWFDLKETKQRASHRFAAQAAAYRNLLRAPEFWGYALCMTASTSAFYAFLSGAPLIAERDLGLSPAALGAAIGSITAGFAFGAFLSGRYGARLPLARMILLGRIVVCVGLVGGIALIVLDGLSVSKLFGATLFVGLGNGMTLPNANVGAMSVNPGLSGAAAGLAGALTIGGGAVVSLIAGAVAEASGAVALLGLMLAVSLGGLAAAVYVERLDAAD